MNNLIFKTKFHITFEMITTSNQGLLYLPIPYVPCCEKLDFVACQQQRRRSACASALESIIAKPVTCKKEDKKVKFHRQTYADPDNSKGGGVGGGGVASRGKLVPVFLLGNK